MEELSAAGGALLEASAEGDLKRIIELTRQSPSVIDYRDSDGLTALHWACLCHQIDVAGELLSRGASLDARSATGSTPLHDACRTGALELVQLLVQRGGDIEATMNDGNVPLHETARSGHVSICKLLLDRGADINVQSSSGNTPLHWACMWGCAEVVSLLVRRGADVGIPNKADKTAADVVISVNDEAAVAVIKALEEGQRSRKRELSERRQREDDERRAEMLSRRLSSRAAGEEAALPTAENTQLSSLGRGDSSLEPINCSEKQVAQVIPASSLPTVICDDGNPVVSAHEIGPDRSAMATRQQPASRSCTLI